MVAIGRRDRVELVVAAGVFGIVYTPLAFLPLVLGLVYRWHSSDRRTRRAWLGLGLCTTVISLALSVQLVILLAGGLG